MIIIASPRYSSDILDRGRGFAKCRDHRYEPSGIVPIVLGGSMGARDPNEARHNRLGGRVDETTDASHAMSTCMVGHETIALGFRYFEHGIEYRFQTRGFLVGYQTLRNMRLHQDVYQSRSKAPIGISQKRHVGSHVAQWSAPKMPGHHFGCWGSYQPLGEP